MADGGQAIPGGELATRDSQTDAVGDLRVEWGGGSGVNLLEQRGAPVELVYRYSSTLSDSTQGVTGVAARVSRKL